MRTTFSFLAVALVALGGCTNASIAEAYGRPHPLEWTYFAESSNDVVDALQSAFSHSNVAVESIRREDDGSTTLTVSRRLDGTQSSLIVVQPTSETGFLSRAQVLPGADPLPRWLEIEVTSLL